VKRIVAKHTYPKPGHGALPAQDQLTPVGTSGPQTWMPITPARWDNAKTIVHEAIKKHMGLRAAVIAVATSMQESTLLNLNYGDSDSLGLFQQRPSCGWGTPSQIEHPSYAADAFLNALRTYQANNPGWAHQPLWAAAQGVQGSAFPSAYAKWEAQAAHLVASATKHLVDPQTRASLPPAGAAAGPLPPRRCRYKRVPASIPGGGARPRVSEVGGQPANRKYCLIFTSGWSVQ
jgi:hypothetical protein